ncbi:FAD/NAD(P)-binding domain-containing protein [Ramaria rubella]|nr:FAD/NAD(P)-binding domain-containing protein [Ramaria rubella]
MSLPSEIQTLVVGAGPTGLVAAITLAKLGLQVAIVDASPTNPNGSRAGVVHARTLEVLDDVDLATPVIEAGTRSNGVVIHGSTNKIFESDFTQLRDYTEFPFSVLIPQDEIERIFREKIASEHIPFLRNMRVVGLHQAGKGADVLFDDGSVVRAQYIVGADGARSTIRQVSGIAFKDPKTGIAYDDTSVPASFCVVLADVFLQEPLPKHISLTQVSIYSDKFFLLVPFNSRADPKHDPIRAWRIGFGFSASEPLPPKNPSMEYLQEQVDARDPHASKIIIESVSNCSRYRVRAAVADTYFHKIGEGNVLLAGDAAHVHSPAGAQGMNLGICDAFAAAHAIKAHVDAQGLQAEEHERDNALRRYGDSRRKIGIRVIGVTRGLTVLINSGTGWRRVVRNLLLRLAAYLPFVGRRAAWRISGLANRDG